MTSSTSGPAAIVNSGRQQRTSSSPANANDANQLTDFSIQAIIGQHRTATVDFASVVQLTSNESLPEARHGYSNPFDQTQSPSKHKPSTHITERPMTSPFLAKTLAGSHASILKTRKVRPKNFLCATCKMSFANSGQLKNHVRIHTGERPFRCDFVDCGKSFTRNEELTRHKLIHSGYRPHNCHQCGKHFGRKDHLKKHLRTHETQHIKNKRLKRNLAFSKPHIEIASNQPRHEPPKDLFGQQCQMPPTIRYDSSSARLDRLREHTLIPPQMLGQAPNIPVDAPSAYHTPPTTTFINSPSGLSLPPTSAALTTSAHTLMMQQAASLGSQVAALQQQTVQPPPSIQQLAQEYWSRWYSFIRLYQNN